jgi:DNA-binding LacI/PurR family transcriptional regulator
MKTEPRRLPTAADVALLSGVSRATVSYVINRTPGQKIPEATRRRVLESADRLGYVPSAAAQALARGTANVVIIDVSDLPGGDLLARTTRDLADSFAARNYSPVINQYTPFIDGHSALLALARATHPAAVVALTELPDSIRDQLLQLGVRQVHSLVAAEKSKYGVGSEQAVAQVDHLANSGHRKILYAGTADPVLRTINETRERAVHAHCADLGITAKTCPPIDSPDFAAALAERVHNGFSSVAAYNDEVGIAVLGAAARAGIQVPGVLAVIGIDDIPLAGLVHPRLTTVTLEPVGPQEPRAIADRVLNGSLVTPFSTVPRIVVRESA